MREVLNLVVCGTGDYVVQRVNGWLYLSALL